MSAKYSLEVRRRGVAAGLLAYVLGGLLLFSPDVAIPWQAGSVMISPWLIGAISAARAGYFVVVDHAGLRVRKLGLASGRVSQIGASAVVVTALSPGGVVRLSDEEWSAVLVGGDSVVAGASVEVVARDGLRLRVRHLPSGALPPGVAGALGDPLTRREREVAALIARGLTNRQIAEELVIAEMTADRHVSNVSASSTSRRARKSRSGPSTTVWTAPDKNYIPNMHRCRDARRRLRR